MSPGGYPCFRRDILLSLLQYTMADPARRKSASNGTSGPLPKSTSKESIALNEVSFVLYYILLKMMQYDNELIIV